MTLKDRLSATIAALLVDLRIRDGCSRRRERDRRRANAQRGQGGGGGGGPGGQAARPPTAEEIAQLPAERRTPAEQQTALAKNPNWKAPRTSWGDPAIAGTYSTDDMRGIPRDRPQALATQESLPQEQFLARAVQQYTGATRAATTETFLRNEWGTRTFGFTSLIVDPPDGRQPADHRCGSRAPAGRKQLVQQRPIRFVRRFLALRPLYRPRHQQRHERRDLRQRRPGLPEPWGRDDHVRDDPRDARHSPRQLSRIPRSRSSRATRAATGRAIRSSSRAAASRIARASAAPRTARTCARRSAFAASIPKCSSTASRSTTRKRTRRRSRCARCGRRSRTTTRTSTRATKATSRSAAAWPASVRSTVTCSGDRGGQTAARASAREHLRQPRGRRADLRHQRRRVGRDESRSRRARLSNDAFGTAVNTSLEARARRPCARTLPKASFEIHACCAPILALVRFACPSGARCAARSCGRSRSRRTGRR